MVSDCSGPLRHRMRMEPDIPLDFSDIAIVKEMIARNNSQTKLRRRLKPGDFINEVFSELGSRATTDSAFVAVVFEFLEECMVKHGSLPRSATLAKVLYSWLDKGLVKDGQVLLRRVLQANIATPRVVVDEKVATVSLRLLTESEQVDLDLAAKIISLLPDGSHRRRLYLPLFEHAARTGDVSLAFGMLRCGRSKGIEFWDVDYHQLLLCLERVAATRDIEPLMTELLECMVDHHPVVGGKNGALLRKLLKGEATTVNKDKGMCDRCGTALYSFDFSPGDRETLLNDIETKLIEPRLGSPGSCESASKVSSVEIERRVGEFQKFKELISILEYDAVIDGANVGYYGLSSWYRAAKEALLSSRGVDPTKVSEHELCEVPVPVDVPPKFPLIDEMLTHARRLRSKSLVMLHRRHRNLLLESSLVVCPGFLNDDYCWLYAAIRKPNCLVVSNDQMRDHHFSLLSRRSFLRWRQRHRVTYAGRFNRMTGAVTLLLSPPRPYAIWVQRGRVSGTHWHIPVRSTCDIIDQATNRKTENDVDVGKDGDDAYDTWLCTAGSVCTRIAGETP
uniref:PRORP domain-containing protein n=1 Tax=Trypanosoma vivax (strain Y486) TaxID=1055687 RepID=G0U2R3_TRYVY|nr:conserved hypothetical protein, fragment [Trypanosoma vivax Y486]